MPSHDLSPWQHSHQFDNTQTTGAQRRTSLVLLLSLLVMLVELGSAWFTGSMALLADAWHMAGHVGAMGIAVWAYRYARRHADNLRFCFGTGKVSSLAGYTNALILASAALWMAWESLLRLTHPSPIHYGEAMAVACLGLVVNLWGAWLLGHGDHHHHERHEPPDHGHHHDHNMRAAYLHVLADALTSVLAIAALAGGWLYGWSWLDPLMGLVGAIIVGHWAWHLAGECAHILLDAENQGRYTQEVRAIIEAQPDQQVADLHLWRITPQHWACALTIVSHRPHSAAYYRAQLERLPWLSHLTIEAAQCRNPACASQ